DVLRREETGGVRMAKPTNHIAVWNHRRGANPLAEPARTQPGGGRHGPRTQERATKGSEAACQVPDTRGRPRALVQRAQVFEPQPEALGCTILGPMTPRRGEPWRQGLQQP